MLWLDKSFDFFFSLAEEALHDSKVAIDNGSFRMSVNRSYYAAFYAATAMLLKKDLYHKTHSVLFINWLEFVVNGDFDNNIAKFLSSLESYRSKSDYGYIPQVTETKASRDLEKAEKFCKRMWKNMKNIYYTIIYFFIFWFYLLKSCKF